MCENCHFLQQKIDRMSKEMESIIAKYEQMVAELESENKRLRQK